MSDVVYLYGFVPAAATAPPPDLRGIGGAAVTLLDIGGTQAAVSHLNDPEYHAERVEQRLTDLTWVAEQGLAHERVVAWFVDHADILPARLFSLHSSEEALRDALAASAPDLASRLRAFAGRREWDLKVAYDATELENHGAEISAELRALDDDIAHAPPGRRYLLERKRAERAKQEVRRSARRLADELFAELAAYAIEARVLPLGQEAGASTVVLTAALLVERSAEAALRREAADQIQQLGRLGLLVSFSGPWAPYRFVDADAATP